MYFHSHDLVPRQIAAYIRTVADVKDIRELSLNDINDFMNGLEVWEVETLKKDN